MFCFLCNGQFHSDQRLVKPMGQRYRPVIKSRHNLWKDNG